MKKVFLNCVFITVFALIIAAFISCVSVNKGKDGVYLLESMTVVSDRWGISTYSFEYDDNNRIIRISYYQEADDLLTTVMLEYSGNDLVNLQRTGHIYAGDAEFENYTRNGNTITIAQTTSYGEKRTHTINLNDDGYIVRDGYTTYQYNGVNPVKMIYSAPETNEMEEEYQYDNKKSPFYYDKTPKWFLQYFFGATGIINNVIVVRTNLVDFDYNYEFNAGGLPTKQTVSFAHGGIVDYGNVTHFVYR